jgi:hypothetical protein
MQRWIKSFAVGIFCLLWSVPALAQGNDTEPATCTAIPDNSPLQMSSPSVFATNSGPHFLLECLCSPNFEGIQNNDAGTGPVRLTITESTTNNGSASIIASQGTNRSSTEIEIPYELTEFGPGVRRSSALFSYVVQVSAAPEDLRAGQYSITVQFELLNQPVCRNNG